MWYAISLVLINSIVLAVPDVGPSCSGNGVFENEWKERLASFLSQANINSQAKTEIQKLDQDQRSVDT